MPSRHLSLRRTATVLVAFGSLIVAFPSASADATGSVQPSGVARDPNQLSRIFIDLYNARRFDDLRSLFTEDAVFTIQNKEPMKGAEKIVGFFEQVRPLFGEFEDDEQVHRSIRSSNVVTRSVSYRLKNGVRTVDTEVIVRQPDGTWRYAIAQAALRDPLP